ncbi:MAG TPA: FixH family protein [Candidatus Limnocylindria bacterium]|nr:FixH family protein [Candidatus Limnocylindria bacterium]
MTQAKPIWNPWPTAIIGWFIIFFSGIVVYTTWSIRQRVDLVGVDYYDQEMRFQHRLDSMNRTQRMAEAVRVEFVSSSREIVVGLPAEHAPLHPIGTIQLYRPSDARLDHRTPLALDARGQQSIDANGLAEGLWKVRVSWTAGTNDFFRDETIVLTPAKR